MSDIFISYANEDRQQARVLASALEKLGWSVWWDRKILTGQEYDQVIERELGSAKSVVVLWSSHSVASEWVKTEAAVAAERGVLLPAAIERIPAPLEFRRRQAADLVGWNGDSSSPGLLALREGLSTIISGIKPPPQMDGPTPAVMGKRRFVMAGLAGALVVLLAGAYWMGRSSRGETHAPGQEPVPSAPTQSPSQVPSQSPAGAAPAGPGAPRPSPADTAAPTSSTSLNLLSPKNGGQLLQAPSDKWAASVDGNVEQFGFVQVGEEAVYGFKDGHRATFETFGMLIPQSGTNPKEFELLVADESPSGAFQSIGTFHPQDAKVFKTGGWQDFTFSPVTARYLKLKLRVGFHPHTFIHLYEFRLIGRLAAGK